jgi:hypothetical protein
LWTAASWRSRPQPNAKTYPNSQLNVTLQDDFSLNQTLSLYLLDALTLIDPASPTYPQK